MNKEEYDVANYIFHFDLIGEQHYSAMYPERTGAVDQCLKKGWIKSAQSCTLNWDDKRYLRITSQGILKINLYLKRNARDQKQTAQVRQGDACGDLRRRAGSPRIEPSTA